MRVQIVHNQPNLASIWIAYIQHFLDLFRPIFASSPVRYRYVKPSGKWFNFHKYFSYAISDVLVVNALHFPGFSRYRFSDFSDQLFGRFIHANHRIIRVIWEMLNIKNIFHRRYKG